jgi:chemotaxis protein CheX
MEELVKHYSNATAEIFKEELNVEVKPPVPIKESGNFVTEAVAVAFGILGEWEGQIFFDLNEKTANTIIDRILKENIAGDQTVMLSGIAELANIISGRACTLLEKHNDIKTKVSPPIVMYGKNVIVSTLEIIRYKFIFKTGIGNMVLRVGLRPGDLPR